MLLYMCAEKPLKAGKSHGKAGGAWCWPGIYMCNSMCVWACVCVWPVREERFVLLTFPQILVIIVGKAWMREYNCWFSTDMMQGLHAETRASSDLQRPWVVTSSQPVWPNNTSWPSEYHSLKGKHQQQEPVRGISDSTQNKLNPECLWGFLFGAPN